MAFNIGTIESKIKCEGLAQFGDDLKKVDATMDAFAQQTSRRFTRVEMDVKSAAKAMGVSTQDMQSQLDRALKSISADTASKSLERLAKQAGFTKSEIQNMGQQMGLSARSIDELVQKVYGAGKGFEVLKTLIAPIGTTIVGAFAVNQIAGFVQEIANTKMQFEAFDRTLKTVTGSQTAAYLAMESLTSVSDRLGLKLTDTAGGYKLIAAAAKGTVLEGEETKKTFEAVSTAASVLGLSASDTNGILLAISQSISKGKVQAEELRGQIGERLPGAFQIAARGMGMTTAELDKLMSTGGLATDEWLPKFRAELEKTFIAGAADAGNSTQASFNRMANAWDQFKAAVADTSAFGVIIAAMNKTAAAADAVAKSIRGASGTLHGSEKVENLQQRLDLLQSPDAVYAYGLPENFDPNKAKAEIEKITKELAAARQDIEDAAYEQEGKRRQNATNKLYSKEQAAIKGGEQATLDAWASSTDKKVALWATQQKEISDAYQKAYKGEITQGAMEVLVDESNKKYAEGLDGLTEKENRAASAAERHGLAVEKLGTSIDNYLAREMGLANNDQLSTKFAAIDEQAAGLINRAEQLAIAGGVSMKEVIEKVTAAKEAAKEYAASNLIETLFPYLKKDNTIQAFWEGIRSQHGYLVQAAQKAGMAESELMSLMVDKTKFAEYQQQMAKVKAIMENTFDFASWNKNRNKLQGLEYQNGGTQEKTTWESTLQTYDDLSGKMLRIKSAMYDRIVEKAKAAGLEERVVQAILTEKYEEELKQQLELTIKYSNSFGDTLSSTFALAFGTYKSEATRAREDWAEFSTSLVELTQGAVESISGSFGDMIRNFSNDTASIQNLSKNMLSRLLDSAASFAEKSIKSQLNDVVRMLLPGSTQGADGSSGLTSSAASISAATASMSVATATINVASSNMAGSASLTGSSGNDTLDADRFGKSAGNQFASAVTSSSNGDLIITTTQGVESLIGGTTKRLGDITGKYESGANYGTISTGNKWGDPGGVSYGKYQFTTNSGSAAELLKAFGISNAPAAGTDAFNKMFSELSKQTDFQEAQEKFAQSKFYSPVISHLEQLGVDIKDPGIQETAFATGVGHGASGAIKLIDKAFKNSDIASMSDMDVISAIYAERMKPGADGTGLAYWAKSPPRVQDSVYNRLDNERQDVLDLSSGGQGSTDAKQFSQTWGSAAGDQLYDKMTEKAANNGYTITTSVQSNDTLRSGSDDNLSKSNINWNKAGTALAGVSMLAAGLSSGNAGTSIGGGLTAVGGILSMMTSLGSLSSVGGPVTALLGMGVGIASGLFSSSSQTSKTGSGYNIAINAGKVSMSGLDFYKTTTTSGTGGTSTSHSTVDTGIVDPAVAKQVEDSLKSAAKSLKDFGKELGITTVKLANFTIPKMSITSDQLSGYLTNMTELMAVMSLDQQGLLGAFDYVKDGHETDTQEFQRLGSAYSTVGGYTEAYGYSLETMGEITKDQIKNMRDYNNEVAKNTLPSQMMMLVAMGGTADQMQQLASSATSLSVAANQTDEQLSKIIQADYASKLEEAVGGEDAFKTIMGHLVGKTLTGLQEYQKQAAYYTDKAQDSFKDLETSGVTIENFWTSFSAAISKGISVDQFEAWSDASNWVYNLNTIQDAITEWQKTITKVSQSLNSRNLKAQGYDTAASAASQLADAEWELVDARKAGYDAATLAAIEATQQAEKAKALQNVFDSANSALDSAIGDTTLSDIKSIANEFNDWVEAAKTLGATEEQLSEIREKEAEVNAAKLSSFMDGIRSELSKYDGTELQYNVGSFKKELTTKLYDAALLGASQTDMHDVGMLYAYKVKEAYQDKINDIVDKLNTASSALKSFSDSIKEFLSGLWTNADTSPLALRERYATAKRQWEEGAADLNSTDEATRTKAQDKIQDLTSTYLDASKLYNADPSAYYTDFISVQKILGDSYTQAKTQYELIEEQVKQATATADSTKTTAELLDQLKTLQQQQGDAWTQMINDLPAKIAAAMAQATTAKQAAGIAGAGAGGSSSSIDDVNAQWGAYYSSAQAASSKYLDDKAAQLNAEGYQGKTDWDATSAYKAISDSGLTPFQHYQQYGKSEGLTWSDQNAFSDKTNFAYTVGGFDSTGWNTDKTSLSFLDPSNYLQAKAEQLKVTTGRTWTVDEVAKALAAAGLTAAQHYEQYGQYEGIRAGSGYVGGSDTSGFNSADYIAAKTAELNATNEGGHSWTAAETAAAIAAAGLTPEQHYAEYGKNENIPGYAVGGFVGDLARLGGYIPGYSAEDVLMARLRLGEFVMTPEAVQYYGPDFMSAANTMKLPKQGFADGGLVGVSFSSSQNSSSTNSDVAALAKSVEALTKKVEDLTIQLNKKMGRVADNTDRMLSHGITVVSQDTAS